MVGRNRGIIQYSAAQKRAYYARKGRKRSVVKGSGGYRIGRPYIRGRGGYLSNMFKRIPRNFFNARRLGSNLGGAAGAAIGNMIAPGVGAESFRSVGSTLGEGLGGIFKNITGFGEYKIRSNTLMPDDNGIVPSFGDGSIRVMHREYITDVNATTAFTNNSFPVNPGLSETFPWLSSIANNFEQYRWNGLLFQFVSTSSDAIASTTDLGMGQVILASDYNAADAAYVNAPQMLGTMFSNSAKVSENILHAVECAPDDQAQKLYYTRSGDVPSGTDIRLYDMLSFQLATQKMPANYDGAGQLWVSYDITLCKAQQNNQLGFDINTDKYYVASGIQDVIPLGATGVIQTPLPFSNLGTIVGDSQIAFPVDLSSGYYMIVSSYNGGSVTTAFPSTTGTRCTKMLVWQNNTALDQSNSGAAGTRLVMVQIWRIDDRDAFISYSDDGDLPSNSTLDLVITQLNGEIFGDNTG